MTGGPFFGFVQDLLQSRAGIELESSKSYLLSSRLASVARDAGFRSHEELLGHLARHPNRALEAEVIDAMLTTESSFFRDVRPFEALRHQILPELIAARQQRRTLNIWSAACSSGQEPFSIAMMIREHFPELRGWQVTILASDLSQAVLSRAAEGRFGRVEVNRGLPASLLVKYFNQRGIEWQVDEVIRSMVTFRRINLCDAWPALPAMDLILLRNVLIYLRVRLKEEVLARAARLLEPDGYLFLGAAETTVSLETPFSTVSVGGTICYKLKEKDDGVVRSRHQ
jgi:chemotaxis protein methyltransferase CheR